MDIIRLWLTAAQTVTVDAVARHPRSRQLEARLAVGGVEPRGMARAAVTAAFAASSWAALHEVGGPAHKRRNSVDPRALNGRRLVSKQFVFLTRD